MTDVRVVAGRPPLYDSIVAAFPRAEGKHVVFAWGDTIYAPGGGALPPQIMEHELVHCGRQLEAGVEKWWGKYLESPEFRLEEELLGHRRELAEMLQGTTDRNRRALYVQHVAQKLASPLYGGLVTAREAARLLTGRR